LWPASAHFSIAAPSATPAFVRYRRYIEPADRRLRRDLHVHLAVQRDAAGKADIGAAGLRDGGTNHLGGDDLELLLAAGGDIGKALVERLPANAARPEDVLELLGKDPFLPRPRNRW